MLDQMVQLLDAEGLKKLKAAFYEQDIRNQDKNLTLTKTLNAVEESKKKKKEVH
jgi:hypothetical protein